MVPTPQFDRARLLADAVVSLHAAPDVPTLLHRLVTAASRLTGAGSSNLVPADDGTTPSDGAAAGLSVTLAAGGRPWLALVLGDRQGHPIFTAEEEHLVGCLAAVAAAALDHCSLRRHQHRIQDTVVQRLFGTGLSLHHLAGTLPGDLDSHHRIERAIDDLHETVRLVQADAPTDELASDREPEDLRL